MNARLPARIAAAFCAWSALRHFLNGRAGAGIRRGMEAWLALRSPALLPNHNFHGPLAREFAAEGREVWLTIDDGPCRRDTEAMLRALDAHGAKATFFVVGREVERRPAVVREILDAGHTVENHTWSHRGGSFWIEPYFLAAEEIRRCSHAIRCAGGTPPSFFRAPGGRYSAAIARAALDENLGCVGWSASGRDGACCGDLWASMNRLLAGVRPGAILLLHQGGRTGRAEALKYLLFRLEQGGWKTVLPSANRLR